MPRLQAPVVILAHMTTHAVRQDGCERYVDSANRLCAQKLCGWAPCELRDNAAAEDAEDLAESVRIGYVAATRAKDLLVVSASGLGPWEESWLSPLYTALYPPKERWSRPDPYPPHSDPTLPDHRVAGRAGPGRAGQGRAGPGRAEPSRARAGPAVGVPCRP